MSASRARAERPRTSRGSAVKDATRPSRASGESQNSSTIGSRRRTASGVSLSSKADAISPAARGPKDRSARAVCRRM